MRAIILAGGRASRLGPLTAQMNKGLVSVGQRPIIIHQLDLLKAAGVTEVVVVTSPQSRLQVTDVLQRSTGGFANISIKCVAQEHALGPADAVRVGADYFTHFTVDPIFVIMADTFVSETLTPGDWVGIAPAPATRSWCYYDRDDGKFSDGDVCVGESVTIGVYCFSSQVKLFAAAALASANRTGDEAPMSGLLNAYVSETSGLTGRDFKTWLDVGDVTALANAKRQRFITREKNNLTLTDQGVLIKSGRGFDIRAEAKWLSERANDITPKALIFPRVLWASYDGDHTEYAVEHIDLPTLAELYLYWPGVPSMWADILRGIISRLGHDLWNTVDDVIAGGIWQTTMYSLKPQNRLEEWQGFQRSDRTLVERLHTLIAELDPDPTMVTGHGDLNFGNILYSLSTGNFKLVDPRGDDLVDRAYELAKLRYSYRDGFSAITHDLFELSGSGVRLGPQRDAEAKAMDEVMAEHVDLRLLSAIEATLFLSAVPLHSGDQQVALYRQGWKLAREALDGSVA